VHRRGHLVRVVHRRLSLRDGVLLLDSALARPDRAAHDVVGAGPVIPGARARRTL
jgi:hypothetical protein